MGEVKVYFPENGSDLQLQFVVVGARYQGQWLFVLHKQRSTYEIPGGHIEPGEHHAGAAARELYEETGAIDFTLYNLGCYVVEREGTEPSGGMLYVADIVTLGKLPEASEIGSVHAFDELPHNLTYPAIQPMLQEKLEAWLLRVSEH